MDKVKLKCLTQTHNGLIYKEWRGETDYHYIVIRDVLTEIQFGMDEREHNAIYKTKTIFKKPIAQFWHIKDITDSIGMVLPEDYIEV